VVAFYVRGNTSSSTTAAVTINNPPGTFGTWTQLVAQRGTNTTGDLNNRITTRAWYRWEDPVDWDENAEVPKTAYVLTLAYANSGGGTTTGLVRGATGYNFPNAKTASNVQTSTVGSASVAETTSTAIGTRFLFMTGGIRATSLSSSAPTDFSGTSNNLDTSANGLAGSIAVGSYVSTAKVGSGVTSGAVSASWNAAPLTQASLLVAIS
jgi:hypothetical protein